jgi:UTP--glucose-1-phosphate uridylyltransferase
MNSFSTSDKTLEHFEEKKWFGIPEKIRMFDQYIAPRITEDGEEFVPAEEEKSFYGPGHGDFPYAVKSSGLLKEFLDGGGKYIFCSNVDNLGARVEPSILGFHITKGKELTAEVAARSAGDIGGAPALVDGRLHIVEGFCFPRDFEYSKIPVFNCSTYWVNAECLNYEFELPWYIVKKKVEGTNVIQFEHLAGDMTRFLSTVFLNVSREERFFPIKRPEDLVKNRQKLKEILTGSQA